METLRKFCIKELKLDDENPATGIQAISFVDTPAIETNFEYFAKNDTRWIWTASPETIDTSHEFCKKFNASNYPDGFTQKEINTKLANWTNKKTGQQDGFINDSNFFSTFNENVSNYRGDQQLFNCRHVFERVGVVKYEDESLFFKFEIMDKMKKRVRGLVLKSHQMIYRQDADGKGNPGYVFMTGETVKKLKEKFGFNRSISFMHRETITGNAILCDSWIEEKDDVKWFMEYQIIGDSLWAQVESGKVKGFSVEMIMKVG